ncbi:hypothetical protein ACHAWX_004624 [Stephanocyclus meneghinianus]
MDVRKRPRLQPQGTDEDAASSSVSPAIALLETQLSTLRTQLSHSQSMRSLERKSYTLNEERLKRQIADAHLEAEQQREINDEMKNEMEQMENQINQWMERARDQQQRDDVSRDDSEGGIDVVSELGNDKCHLLQQRLDATTSQVGELTRMLKRAQEHAAAVELKAANTELQVSQLHFERKQASASSNNNNNNTNDENCNPHILRATRIQLAESERCNRELTRQNNDMKGRLKDMIQYKERSATLQRRAEELEKEVQRLQHSVEMGKEVERKWMEIRREIVEEGLVNDDDIDDEEREPFSLTLVGIPPEIATMVRKFQSLKQNVKRLEEENNRLSTISNERSQRCSLLEKQSKSKDDRISLLEKEVETAKENLSRLELENRKIVAQQVIWKRESESMRLLLDTYEMQEPNLSQRQSKSSAKTSSDVSSPAVKGLQLSLQSAQDEIKLLTETNHRLDSELDSLRTQHQASQSEHERVLEKFAKLRSALMEERSKAQAAEERACQAETLAGKGSYNPETTRVVHLESNPMSNAVREKYQTQIDSLTQKLEDAQKIIAESSGTALGTTTPAPSRSSGGFGSGATSTSSGQKDGLSSLDAQKLHKRLKERFKEQIGLFREGVYLITGCKIDMSFSDSDCPHFKVRSIYGEREEDHLMFQWQRKKGEEGNDLDLMSTDLAQLLMNGPSAIYMTKFNSVPAFMASVTLALFEKQTMI